MNVKKIIQNYQLLKLMNNKLKCKMSKTKIDSEKDKYDEYKELQKQVENLLLQLEECDSTSVDKIKYILEQEANCYLMFRILAI